LAVFVFDILFTYSFSFSVSSPSHCWVGDDTWLLGDRMTMTRQWNCVTFLLVECCEWCDVNVMWCVNVMKCVVMCCDSHGSVRCLVLSYCGIANSHRIASHASLSFLSSTSPSVYPTSNSVTLCSIQQNPQKQQKQQKHQNQLTARLQLIPPVRLTTPLRTFGSTPQHFCRAPSCPSWKAVRCPAREGRQGLDLLGGNKSTRELSRWWGRATSYLSKYPNKFLLSRSRCSDKFLWRS